MSLKFNIAANYVSQFYVAAVGILVVPAYLGMMGPEAFGLVGFFTLLQAWFQLFDVGLTATMSREAARHAGGASDRQELRRLLRSLEGVFAVIGLIAALALTIGAPAIRDGWLRIDELPQGAVAMALGLMAFTLALRWVSGLYRGVVLGLERQVWLSVFNAVIATMRFVIVLPLIYLTRGDVVAFFAFQLMVSAVELVVLAAYSYVRIPLPEGVHVHWSLAPLRNLWKFSATVAFTSVVWIVVTQTDRLILSKILSLHSYGLFIAAVLLASAVTLVSMPITQALLPRLARLAAEHEEVRLIHLYRQGTQAVTAIAGSATLVLVMLAKPILWVWTGDAVFASRFAPVLALYALGNGFLALAAFPYYLQYAKGDLRLHFWGNVFFVAILVPAIVVATTRYGVLGAASVWALTNGLFFLFWVPYVHQKFVPGLHRGWLLGDVLRVLVPAFAVGLLPWFLRESVLSRVEWGAIVVATAGVMTIVAFLSGGLLRKQLNLLFQRVMPASRRA